MHVLSFFFYQRYRLAKIIFQERNVILYKSRKYKIFLYGTTFDIHLHCDQRLTDRYLKNGVLKSFVLAIRPAKFQPYMTYPTRII